jgi:hypothetical protein
MSCLDATFTLTPRSPSYYNSVHNRADLFCFGADFMSFSPYDLSSLYASDRFCSMRLSPPTRTQLRAMG